MMGLLAAYIGFEVLAVALSRTPMDTQAFVASSVGYWLGVFLARSHYKRGGYYGPG